MQHLTIKRNPVSSRPPIGIRPRKAFSVCLLTGFCLAVVGAKASAETASNDAPTSPTASVYLSGEDLLRDAARYVEFGPHHRTGTAVDLLTSGWLADELRWAGAEAELQRFDTPVFQLEAHSLAVGERAIESFPVWLPQTTGPEPIRAQLTLPGVEERGRIVFFNGRARYHANRIMQAARNGAVGAITINLHPSLAVSAEIPGPPFNERPWPIPVATADPRENGFLRAAAENHYNAELLIDGQMLPQAGGRNVVARLDAEGSERTIVISASYNAMFAGAGESGAPAALLLGLARWTSARGPAVDHLFVAYGGGELGGLGRRAFMESELAPAPEKVVCWIELGSGLGTRGGRGAGSAEDYAGVHRLQASRRWLPLLDRTFSGLGGVEAKALPVDKDYPVIRLSGANLYEGTAQDGIEVVSADYLGRIARALAATLGEIEKRAVGGGN